MWSTGATTSSINVTTAGSYTVQVTNAAGCQSAVSAAVVVTINSLPVVDAGTDATIPNGTNTTLNATVTGTGPFTYSWLPPAMLVDALVEDPTTVNLSTTTVFTLTATSTATSCSNSDAVTITVSGGALSSTPTATPSTICAGTTVQLDAVASGGTGTYTYSWTSVPAGFTSSSATPTATPGVSTVYHVEVYDGFNTVNAQVSVTVNSLPATPTITASGPITFCTGGSVTLTSSAGTTYLWSNGATTASINVTTAGSYTVQVTNANGCLSPASAATVVTVNTLPATPTITASGPTTFCAGGSVTLTSSAGTTYLWSNGATTSSINVTTAGTYTVQVTNANGCLSPASAATVVTINALPATPTITASGPTTFCAGGSVTLTSSAGTTYLWSTGATTSSINVTTADSYTVQITNANGCLSPASAATVVIVNALPATPTITASGPITFCDGGSVTLTSSAGTTYLWSNGATTSSINATTDGSYTVQVTNANGCLSSASTATVVTVNALPTTPTIAASGPTTFCDGGSVILTSSAGTTYLWSNGATTSSINATISGSYTVQITNIAGCISAESTPMTVTVNALPSTPVISASGSTTICEGNSVTLTSSAATNYLWSTGSVTSSINVTTSGSYTVQVTDANGCQSLVSAPTVVTVNTLPAAPTITDSGATTFCEGGSVTLTSSAGTTYLWSNGSTTASINATISGSYSVQVTNANGCLSPSSALTTVTVNPLPITPFVTASGFTTFCEGGSVTLTSSTGSTYLWSNSETTASIDVDVSGSYTVQITDANGCLSAASNPVEVIVNPIPSTPVITPSGPLTFCEGGNVTLSSSAGSTYLWSTGATTSSIIVSVTGSYNVIVTNASGCQSAVSANTDIVVNSLPVVDAGVDASVANGSIANLDATVTGAGPFTYSWTPSALLVDASVEDPTTLNLTSTTVFTLLATSQATGCSASDVVIITVTGDMLETNPSAVPETVCAGASVQLYSLASGGTGTYTYSWTSSPAGFASTDANPIVNPTENTTYYVEVSDGFSIVNGQISVTVIDLPLVDAGVDQTVCDGDLITLSGSGADTYTWDNGVTNGVPFSQPTGVQTYIVTGTLNGCTNTDEVDVTVLALPSVNAGFDQTVCDGEMIILSGSGADTYIWDNSVTDGTPFLQPVGTVTYTVTGTQNGCSATDVVDVTVVEGPTVSVTPVNATCGMADGTATVDATGGSGTYTYLWDLAAGSQITVTATDLGLGTYYVTVDDGSCSTVASAVILENGAPVVSIDPIDPVVCQDQSVTLTATGADVYSWSPATYLDNSINAVVVCTPGNTITYTVTGTSGGCSGQAQVTVTFNPLPISGFTYVTDMLDIEITDASQYATSWEYDMGDGTPVITDQNPFYTYIASGTYTITQTVYNACGSNVFLIEVEIIDISVPYVADGISFNLYPNPGSGICNLVFDAPSVDNYTVRLINHAGQIVYTKEYTKKSKLSIEELNFSDQAMGTYRLQLIYNGKALQTPLIINRH